MTRLETWREVPNLPDYEFTQHPAEYGGHIVLVKTRGIVPVRYAAQHVREDSWNMVAVAVARCIATIERDGSAV